MDERTFRSWWRNRLPDLSAAASRFPLAVAIAALLTIYKLYSGDPGDFELRVLGALAASSFWAVAVDLYVESQNRSLPIRVLLWAVGILAIAVLFWLQWDIWFSPPLLLLGLLLLVGLSGHLGRGVLAPWFEGHPNDPFAAGKKPEETARDLLAALGLRPELGSVPGQVYFRHYSDVPVVIDAKGGQFIGPVVFQTGSAPAPIPPQTVTVEGLDSVRLELAGNLLTARLRTATTSNSTSRTR